MKKKEAEKKSEKSVSYLVFARKFRPETFDEVVGQETATQLLKNAIRAGRIPQNFLFSGPRGIGKTSTARILAKALNCAKGPAENPCNQCGICQEITRTVSLDVLEIDGASNRGIEEIRTLRENVKFKPAEARFKIYIIDEVHMLTGEAFNALLKTLEEPPPHVKFIFATTEPHKVPLTILSRCQRFNFKRISTEVIAKKLAEIAKAEGLKAEPAALHLIARTSDGALRDAETLLDQLSALAGDWIREEEVLFALALAGDEVYFDLLEALKKKDAGGMLSLVRDIYEGGKDVVQFGRGLYELFRNLLLLEMAGGAEAFVEMGPESAKRLAGFKGLFSREELLLGLSLLQNLQGDLRRALASPKLLLETALLKLLHLEGLREVKELVEKSNGEGRPTPALPSATSAARPAAPKINASPRSDEPQVVNQTSDFSLALEEIQRVWPQVLEAVKAKEMSTGMFLAEAEPVEVNGQTLVMGFPKEFQFHKEMIDRPEKKKLVEQALLQLLGKSPVIQFVTTQLARSETSTPSSGKEPSQLPDIVQQAMGIFQGSKIIRAD